MATLSVLFFMAAATIPAAAQSGANGVCGNSGAYGSREVTLEFDGDVRLYRVYAPETLPADQPVPLVLSLHGYASDALQQEDNSGWNMLADEYGFIAAYPQATGAPARWFGGDLWQPAESARLVDDVAFIRSVVNDIDGQYCLDLSRVYVNGMSNGGGMSNRLACEASDVFAAAGGVAGAYADFGGCHPERPMPFIAFHGTNDRIVPYEGWNTMLPPIQEWALEWAGRNGCNLTPEMLPATGEVTGIRYTGCEQNADVILYSIDGGGHTWPGSESLFSFLLGRTTQDINASAAMWAFFSGYQLES